MKTYLPRRCDISLRQRWILRIPALLLFAVLSFLYLRRQLSHALKRVDVSALRLVDLNGDLLPDSEIHEKTIVLKFWAPWCGLCRIETPWPQKPQMTHPNDLLVVGVVADADIDSQDEVFMKKRDVPYPIVRETAGVDAVFGAVSGLPTTFYITAQDKVVHAVSGLIPELLKQHYVNDAIKQ